MCVPGLLGDAAELRPAIATMMADTPVEVAVEQGERRHPDRDPDDPGAEAGADLGATRSTSSSMCSSTLIITADPNAGRARQVLDDTRRDLERGIAGESLGEHGARTDAGFDRVHRRDLGECRRERAVTGAGFEDRPCQVRARARSTIQCM